MYLAIYGESGLGHEVLDLALYALNNANQKAGPIFFVVDNSIRNEYRSYPIFSFEDVSDRFIHEDVEFIIAIGEPNDRMRLYRKVKEKGYKCKTLVHPTAYISPSVAIGEGTVIQHGVVLSSDTKVGDNCLFQSLALVGHDCVIGNHCVISSHAAISGNVSIGDNTFIAPGVVIKEKITIGSNSIIGMGAIVQRDIPDNVIALGNPARPMKYKDDNKVFK